MSSRMSSVSDPSIRTDRDWFSESDSHKPSTIRDEVEQQQEHAQEKVEKQADQSKAAETDSTSLPSTETPF